MTKRLQLLFTTLIISLLSCNADHAGKVDETDTSIAGLVSPVGTPVESATVRIQHFRDTSKYQIDSLVTDSNGKYDIRFLEEGTYTIWAESDEYVLFRDSITISENSVYNRIDTMDVPRKVWIPVKLQEQHMDRVHDVRAHILGTHISPVVNKDGFLLLEKIPSATFPLRLSVNEFRYEYTPKTFDITIDTNTPDTLRDTLELAYTGVPVVQNIKANYDTLAATTIVTWDPDTTLKIDRYLIFRDHIDVIIPASEPIGYSTSNSYTDKQFSDTSTAGKYVYRVAILTQGQETGEFWYSDTIDYIHPSHELNVLVDESLSIFLHQNVSIPLSISKWFGNSPKIQYRLGAGPFLDITGNTNIDITIDSSYLVDTPLIVNVTSESEETISDTLLLTVSNQWNYFTVPPTTEGEYLTPIQKNSSVIVPVHYQNSVTFYRSDDSCKSWQLISEDPIPSFDSSRVSNPIYFDEKIWILSGEGLLYSSTDAIQWEQITNKKYDTGWNFSKATTYSLSEINNEIFLVVDNSSTPTGSGTNFHFLKFNALDNEFVPLSENSYTGEYTSQYWLLNGNTSMDLYVFPSNQSSRNIDFYTFNDNDYTITESFKSVSSDLSYRSPTHTKLSAISYGDGIILTDGAGNNENLFIGNNQTLLKMNNHEMMTKPTNLFTLGKTLYSINNDGIFTNK